MDLETENRIAAILLKEAAELRRQAQSEGALAYLRQPTVRGRPNSRFLTATVRGVQQANRVVEVNEMWRLKEKQLELDHRLRGSRSETSIRRGHNDVIESHRSRSRDGNEVEASANATHLSKKITIHDLHPMEDEGLKDDEVDEFLHSRIKRGRGAVGSRMDETGPYLPSTPDSKRYVSASSDEDPKKARVLLGPEKPYSLKPKKHILKDKSRDKKKKRNKEKKSKHRR